MHLKGIPQKPKSYASRNPVAKNIEKFNRPSTHPDKKKELKRKGPDFKSYDMDEATTLVSDKSHIIDSILTQVKEKAMKDDNMIKRLASLIHSTADVRYDSNPRGSWEITPNDKLGKTDWEPMRNEANANQQASLYNPDGKTYRQQKMPHLDPRDPINKAQGFDSFEFESSRLIRKTHRLQSSTLDLGSSGNVSSITCQGSQNCF